MIFIIKYNYHFGITYILLTPMNCSKKIDPFMVIIIHSPQVKYLKQGLEVKTTTHIRYSIGQISIYIYTR